MADIHHLVPVNDIADHMTVNCPCDPDLEEQGTRLYWVHHSWAGIKFLFDIEIMLGMRCGECGRYQTRKGLHDCNKKTA